MRGTYCLTRRYRRMLGLGGVSLALAFGMGPPQKPLVSVEVGPNVRVTDGAGPYFQPRIAAHPDNSRNLVVAVIRQAGGEASLAETFATFDGGGTWSGAQLPRLRELLGEKDLVFAIDPWVAYAPDGMAYCSAAAGMKRGHAWGRVAALFYRSRDQGRTWEGPTATGPFLDRPAVVATGRGPDQRVYLAAMAVTPPAEARVAVLRSDDGGLSFRQTVLSAPNNLGHQPMNPVVSPEGVLIVPYLDFPFRREARALMQSSRIYLVRSKDGGQTFGLSAFVADIPRPLPGFVEAAVDLSPGKYHGRLYAAWNGESEGRQNVTVARSTDNGETWSATALRAAGAGPAQFASLAVSGDGVLGVAWIQHEREQAKGPCWRAYFAASADGGESFTPPAPLSGAAVCADPVINKQPIARLLGGYMGLAVTTEGKFFPVWPDGRDGPLQVYTAPVTVRRE